VEAGASHFVLDSASGVFRLVDRVGMTLLGPRNIDLDIADVCCFLIS